MAKGGHVIVKRKAMYYVYILRLVNGHFYTGSTPNIGHRLTEHENGRVKSTKNFRPVELIWYCVFPTRLQARRFENYLKTGSGQAFRNKRFIINSKSIIDLESWQSGLTRRS